MRWIVRLVCTLLFLCVAPWALAQPAGGHAHNDYEHARPLHDALEHGFTSVEADIWLRDGKLLIGHDAADLDPDLTLESLYLEPLRAAAASVTTAAPLTLLIDIKTDGEATYAALEDVLGGYADMLARVEDGRLVPDRVMAIVSGNRPEATMAAETLRYAFYDGRISDLDSGTSANFMPLVSDNWSKHFSWTGAGNMPSDELAKLTGIVARAHGQGHALRFWATPDQPGPEREALWRTLSEAGVDLINTDDLAGFAAFAAKQSE